MNSKYSTIFQQSIYALIICMSSITTASALENRIPASELLNIEEQRLSQTPKEILEQSIIPQLSYGYNNTWSAVHKLAYTFPVNFINSGQKLQVLDESIWVIHPSQRYQIRQWVQEHTLFIRPNTSWFSRYNYVLYNKDTYESVEAQFDYMPQNFNYYRQKISKIDAYTHVVQLDDAEKTVWQVSFSDSGFNYWHEGDYIIVGVNTDWRSGKFAHILINTSITDAPYCEANFIGNGF